MKKIRHLHALNNEPSKGLTLLLNIIINLSEYPCHNGFLSFVHKNSSTSRIDSSKFVHAHSASKFVTFRVFHVELPSPACAKSVSVVVGVADAFDSSSFESSLSDSESLESLGASVNCGILAFSIFFFFKFCRFFSLLARFFAVRSSAFFWFSTNFC